MTTDTSGFEASGPGEADPYGFSLPKLNETWSYSHEDYSSASEFQPKGLSAGVALEDPDETSAPDDEEGQEATYNPLDNESELGRERDDETWLANQREDALLNRAAYTEMDADLAMQHDGEYVAISAGRVLGFDPDDLVLERRVVGRLGNVDLLLARVGAEDHRRREPVKGPRLKYRRD
jgi:hypothetical protein